MVNAVGQQPQVQVKQNKAMETAKKAAPYVGAAAGGALLGAAVDQFKSVSEEATKNATKKLTQKEITTTVKAQVDAFVNAAKNLKPAKKWSTNIDVREKSKLAGEMVKKNLPEITANAKQAVEKAPEKIAELAKKIDKSTLKFAGIGAVAALVISGAVALAKNLMGKKEAPKADKA